MHRKQLGQSGFAHFFIIVIVVIVTAVGGYSAFRIFESRNSTYTAENSEAKSSNELGKDKSLPVEFGPYDPVTRRAGDFYFPKDFPEGVQKVIFSEFGYDNPGNSANNYQTRKSPQPTGYVASGTKIKSMIDGEVVSVTKLYSDDYSVHIQGEGSELIFEHEHVMDVLVNVGDMVKAGDSIATASSVDSSKLQGLALFEVGVLKGGNPPTHLCLADYFDDSIKQEAFDKINALKKDWEEYKGDNTLYDEANTVIPGCISREPISDNNNSATGGTNQ